MAQDWGDPGRGYVPPVAPPQPGDPGYIGPVQPPPQTWAPPWGYRPPAQPPAPAPAPAPAPTPTPDPGAGYGEPPGAWQEQPPSNSGGGGGGGGAPSAPSTPASGGGGSSFGGYDGAPSNEERAARYWQQQAAGQRQQTPGAGPGYGEPAGAWAEVRAPRAVAAPFVGPVLPPEYGGGYGEPAGAWAESPYTRRQATTGRGAGFGQPVTPVTSGTRPAQQGAVTPVAAGTAPVATAPRSGGGGGGGGGGGSSDTSGLPSVWTDWLRQTFGGIDTYYTPERGGTDGAVSDYKAFQSLWSARIGRWLTVEELARVLSSFNGASMQLGRTPMMSDLFTFAQRQLYRPPTVPDTSYLKPGNL